jgi:hypothetical protein
MWERCGYFYDHHPVSLAPMGRQCEQAAVEVLHWKDGRTSVACRKHGLSSLVPEARLLVKRVVFLNPKAAW